MELKKKRLNIDISAALHSRIKMRAAEFNISIRTLVLRSVLETLVDQDYYLTDKEKDGNK